MLRERFGADVTVIERGKIPGGMLRTLHTEDGLAYEYGPRIVSAFRGSKEVIPFLSKYLTLDERQIYQGTRLRPEYPIVPFPVDRESLMKLPCGDAIRAEWAEIERKAASGKGAHEPVTLRDYLESHLGPTLTGLAFEPFNLKFWDKRIDDMPAEWGRLRRLERVPEKGEYRLPSTAPHYYPRGGFNSLFPDLLGSADVRYGVEITEIRRDANGGAEVIADGETLRADLVISTAPIDVVLGLKHGPLRWKGYRTETETVTGPAFERAPDGVPFSWVYTPWLETPECRTTDFGVIHYGPETDRPSVLLREIPDDSVKMYPLGWETDRFYQYLTDATHIHGFIPLGRLGMYKYVTMDSTYSMVLRLCECLAEYAEASPERRFELLRDVRGDWSN